MLIIADTLTDMVDICAELVRAGIAFEAQMIERRWEITLKRTI